MTKRKGKKTFIDLGKNRVDYNFTPTQDMTCYMGSTDIRWLDSDGNVLYVTKKKDKIKLDKIKYVPVSTDSETGMFCTDYYVDSDKEKYNLTPSDMEWVRYRRSDIWLSKRNKNKIKSLVELADAIEDANKAATEFAESVEDLKNNLEDKKINYRKSRKIILLND